MKEILSKVFKNENVIASLLILLVFCFIFFIIDGEKSKTKVEEVIEVPRVTLSLKGDRNFLLCNREQLECYYKNLGLKKETVLLACQDISYCDGVKK